MADSKLLFELDRGDMDPAAFKDVKNELIAKAIKDALVSPEDDPHAWHVKAEFSKHEKGGIDVSGHGDQRIIRIDPGLFRADSPNIERIKIKLSDV